MAGSNANDVALMRVELREVLDGFRDEVVQNFATKADFANLKTWIVCTLLVAGESGWNGGDDRCVCSDWVGRVAEADAQREQDFEILERFGRAFRDQTAEEIEEAVAQAVAVVRGEERRVV